MNEPINLQRRRLALAFAHCILSDKRNQSRYASTTYGNPDKEMIYLADALEEIALMHNEIKEKMQSEEAP